MKKRISIIVPVYNEEAALPVFYEELVSTISYIDGYDFEIIFVNDGSTDKTILLLENLRASDSRVSIINLSRNFGKESAMLAGFDFADGDAVIVIDADLQDPPALIPKMVKGWEEGYDDVFGRRRVREKKNIIRSGSRFYHRLLDMLADVDMKGDVGDFRLLDARCVKAIRSMRETQRYTKGMFAWIGFRKKAIDFDVPTRVAGKSKWSVRSLSKLALDGITSHSVVPLRLASFVGVAVSIIAFIYLLCVVIKALFDGDKVDGYPSLMAVTLFLGGFILMGLGIIGEYIGRIYIESKDRPVYIIESVRRKSSVEN